MATDKLHVTLYASVCILFTTFYRSLSFVHSAIYKQNIFTILAALTM